MKNEPGKQQRIYEQLAATNKALDSTSDAVIIADNDGVVVYVNPAFVMAFGYTVNELNVNGIPNVLFSSPAVGEQAFRIASENDSWKGEIELETKQGDTESYLVNIDSIMDDKDQRIGFISMLTDITPHKRLSAVQQEKQLMAQAQLDVAKALTSTLELNEVFNRILDNINHVVTNDAANIILIKNGMVELVDRDDYSGRELIERLRSGSAPVDEFDDLNTILKTNAALLIANTQEYLATHDDIQQHSPWLNSHIGIPIRLKDEILGFLNVDSIDPGRFDEEHAKRLQIFAEQAAIAIHNAHLHESAQRLAMLEERQRLARTLHDSVSQMLFSSSLIAESLARLWEKRPDEVLPRLEQIQNLNRGALAEMRTLLLELHPERLLETPIDKLIHQFAESILGKSQLDVKLDVEEGLDLEADVHTAVYYITQEALNNVIKHAEASRVTVQLSTQQDKLTLEIVDNGRGFIQHQIPSTSLGLNIMGDRAQASQAELEIMPKIGVGTRIRVTWSI
jgi:PAS domain S-box-containing protein